MNLNYVHITVILLLACTSLVSVAHANVVLETSVPLHTLDSNLQDITFSNDGLKMFVASQDSPAHISEHELTAPFNTSTAKHVDSFQLDSADFIPTGVTFSNDGRQMFVIVSGQNLILEYGLPAPFDLDTPTGSISFGDLFILDSTIFPLNAANGPSGIEFSDDGSVMFLTAGTTIYEYSLPCSI